MSKFVVVTTINAPSVAIDAFRKLSDWHVVVVGDQKTPDDWHAEGVTYLSPEDQERLPFQIAKMLPWNHYSRKMLGYLFAVSKGATVIADTDDDNIPKSGWGDVDFTPSLGSVTSQPGFVNVYQHFTDQHVWPRGLPLSEILVEKSWSLAPPDVANVGVWQHLADGEPDVDAIYRLVGNQPVSFRNAAPLVLPPGVWSPFNSQNTFFRRELFPLLYLPAHVTFRFTDILRGFVAQPLMWNAGYMLAFGAATVFQERNPHDFFEDFLSEIPMFTQTKVVTDAVAAITTPDVLQGLHDAYEVLHSRSVVSESERRLVEAWRRDLLTAGWQR